MACRSSAPDTWIAGNVFWGNSPTDVGDPEGCFIGWQSQNLVVDPLFCDPASDDYRVRTDSPAITGGRAIGAYLTPGCPTPSGKSGKEQ